MRLLGNLVRPNHTNLYNLYLLFSSCPVQDILRIMKFGVGVFCSKENNYFICYTRLKSELWVHLSNEEELVEITVIPGGLCHQPLLFVPGCSTYINGDILSTTAFLPSIYPALITLSFRIVPQVVMTVVQQGAWETSPALNAVTGFSRCVGD